MSLRTYEMGSDSMRPTRDLGLPATVLHATATLTSPFASAVEHGWASKA